MKRKFLILGIVIVGIVGFAAAVGIFLVIRNALTVGRIKQEWQPTRVEKTQNLGTTRTLEILPLFEEVKARDDLELYTASRTWSRPIAETFCSTSG